MANTIKPKRSNTASKVPNTSELVSGELGVNMADKKIYINNGTSVVQVGAGLLSALGDVTITSPTNGQSLSYNGTAWVNSTGAGSGTVTSVSVVSANGLAGTVATATSTPAITLTTTVTGIVKGNGTALSAAVSGTDYAPATSGGSILYGNGAGGFSAVTVGTGLSFTTGTLSATNAGTVTSVTGTAPVVSSGGATPAISMAAATTSVNGYLTSTDWNTFNGKQAALGFTPYNATNPSNYIALASAITGYTVGTNTALAATDTLLAGLGKIQGQINAKGTGNGTVTSVTGTAPISVATGTTTPVISLDNTAVTAGSYTYASITVDAKGRLTAASNGASPSAFPAGTAMLFIQTAAPTGWTKSTTHDNKALRIVSGTASSGGSVAFTTAFASQSVTGSVAATEAATATNQATTAGGSVGATSAATATNQATTAGGSVGSTGSTTATNQATTETGSISVSVSAGTLAVGIGTLAESAVTLATTQIPSHTHPYSTMQNQALAGRVSLNDRYPIQPATTGATGGGGSHTHSLTGSPSLSGSPSVTGQSFTANAHNHTQDAHSHTSGAFTGTSHNHTQDAHSHTSGAFTGTSHNHTQDAHSHTSGAFTGNAINLAVQYVDAIIATKD